MRFRPHVWTAWLAGRSLPPCQGRASWLGLNLQRLGLNFQWLGLNLERLRMSLERLGLKLQRLRLNPQWLGLDFQRLGLNFEHQASWRPSICPGTHSILPELP